MIEFVECFGQDYGSVWSHGLLLTRTSFASPMFHCRSTRVVAAAICGAALTLPVASLHAQREQLTVRAEALGTTSIVVPTGTAGPSDYAQRSLQLTFAHRQVRQQGNTMILLGGLWRAVEADLPQVLPRTTGANSPSTLHVAHAEVMVLKTLNDRHTVISTLRPGVYGTQFRVEGAAFVDRIVSPRTTLGGGLSYASSYGKLLPIPVLHIVSRPSKRILIDALLPARGEVWWMPRKGLDLGVHAALTGAQFGLPQALQVDRADALWLANATLGTQARWAPNGGKWQLLIDGGTTVVRRLEYARDGEAIADLAPGNVFYLRVGAQKLF